MCIPEAYNELCAISNLHMRKIEWSVVRDVSVVDVVCGVYGVCGECVVSVQFVWCVR
jgi:hypothetical protein